MSTFSLEDTIVALATPAGRGGIGVVRLSGPSAPEIVAALIERNGPLEPRRATWARLAASASQGVLDEVVVTWFAAPASYTGGHVIEVSAHGSPVVLQGIVQRAIDAGARLARPGEFTLRAFLHGKRDLVQAEAVADLIAAATPLQARQAFDQLEGTLTRRIAEADAGLLDLIVGLEASLDFPEEGYRFVDPDQVGATTEATIARLDGLLGDAARGRLIREGATVVLAGRTNVGKSSLFNALVGTDRAIVTEVAGTTRDLVTERIDIEGLAITLVDTAGAREAAGIVEREGVTRGALARAAADLVVVVLDRTSPLTSDDEGVIAHTAPASRIIVVNKSDCPSSDWYARGLDALAPSACPVYDVSARTGDGLLALRGGIVASLTGTEPRRDPAAVSNVRHIALLKEARAHLAAARDAARGGPPPEELLLVDLQAARRCFDEIVGTRTSEDILNLVFERFCIGK
jgi:tRNA modification GTPase